MTTELPLVRGPGGLEIRGAWRERITVDAQELEGLTSGWTVWRQDDDLLRIRVANGQAVYRIIHEDAQEIVGELEWQERDA